MIRHPIGTPAVAALLSLGSLALPHSGAGDAAAAAGLLENCQMTIGAWAEYPAGRLNSYIQGPFQPALTGFAPVTAQAVVWHYACERSFVGSRALGPVNVSMAGVAIEPPDGTITYAGLLGYTHFYAVHAHTDHALLASALERAGYPIGLAEGILYERGEASVGPLEGAEYRTRTRVPSPDGTYGIVVAGAREQDPPHGHNNVWWAWHDDRATGLRVEIALLDAIDKSCKVPLPAIGCGTVFAEPGTPVAEFIGGEEIGVGGLDHARIPSATFSVVGLEVA